MSLISDIIMVSFHIQWLKGNMGTDICNLIMDLDDYFDPMKHRTPEEFSHWMFSPSWFHLQWNMQSEKGTHLGV